MTNSISIIKNINKTEMLFDDTYSDDYNEKPSL